MDTVREKRGPAGFLSYFINPDTPVDAYTRALVLVFLCFLVGLAKFISLLQVMLSHSRPFFLSFGLFAFWMQMMCIPFFIKRTKNLYILSHYTLAMLYAGVLYSSHAGCGYLIVNCTVFPILPLVATFLFDSFKDSFAWTALLLLTNIAFFLMKAEWEPGTFPSIREFSSFVFFANMMSMSISAILGGVFNYSSNLKQKELERERDKAQELSKVKSEFTANVSHEIRTPLVAVIGLSELLAKDALLTSDQRYLINTIYSASLHLDNLVNNVLNFSKTEANMTKLDRTPFDVSELVEETLLYFSAMAESSGIRLLSFIDPISTDGLCSVMGDPHRIQQILQNLVANAIKFCGESAQGEVLITLDTIPSKTKTFHGRWYRFSVADNGIGMSKAGIQKLFQPFSQCDNSTTRRYGGTGLGLVICKQLCTLLGGEIDVDSEEGKGTTITFVLPLDMSDDAEVEAEPHPRIQRRKETAAAAEAAAKAAAHSADAAEEAELEADYAAKAAMDAGPHLTPQERRAVSATASAAKETSRAAKATAEAAHTTAEAASATAEVFALKDEPSIPFPITKLSTLPTLSSPTSAQKRIAGLEPSPMRQPMFEQDGDEAPLEDMMNSLELDPETNRTPPGSAILAQSVMGSDDEMYDRDMEREPLVPQSPGDALTDKARALERLAKDFIANAASWDFPRRSSTASDASAPESPFSKQMRNTLDDIQEILRQAENEKSREQQSSGMRRSRLPSLTEYPSPDPIHLQREAPSPHITAVRQGRSKSFTAATAPFSPRMFISTMTQPQDPNISPPIPNSRVRGARRVSSGMAGERSPMFSPDFETILAKSQDFWASPNSSSGELRRGTTGYLDPIGDSRIAWARIRDGMRASALSSQGDSICVLAGSHGAREVIKSSLLFRGLTNTEVMDGDAYTKLLKQSKPPHFKVVIAEADLFARMSTDGMRDSNDSEGLAEVLNPAIFDPRICTRYILLISCKYHRFGRYIKFAVPPIKGGQEDTVKVVFCANNPVRRSSLAQSLLACVVDSPADSRSRKAERDGTHTQQDNPSTPPQASRGNLRILLCEDNLVNIEVLTRQLKKLGFTNCDIKHNGADGLQAFKEKEYDIILMDCQMPVLDGYETTKEIRKLEQERKAKKRVPIVALTASAMPEERERGMKSGMDNYLSKPIQLAVLQNILESIQAAS